MCNINTNYQTNIYYYDILKDMLWILLEQQDISLDHMVYGELLLLLSIPKIISIFEDDNNKIRISNIRVLQLLELLEQDPSICLEMQKRSKKRHREVSYQESCEYQNSRQQSRKSRKFRRKTRASSQKNLYPQMTY